jgi:hypothetical protein
MELTHVATPPESMLERAVRTRPGELLWLPAAYRRAALHGTCGGGGRTADAASLARGSSAAE